MFPNKYIVYGILVLIAITFLTTYILMWKHSIRQQALLEFNNKQLEQVIKDQQLFIKTMNDIYTLNKETFDNMSKKNEEIKNQLTNVETYLNSDQSIKDNKPSSELLKETIRQLGKVQ